MRFFFVATLAYSIVHCAITNAEEVGSLRMRFVETCPTGAEKGMPGAFVWLIADRAVQTSDQEAATPNENAPAKGELVFTASSVEPSSVIFRAGTVVEVVNRDNKPHGPIHGSLRNPGWSPLLPPGRAMTVQFWNTDGPFQVTSSLKLPKSSFRPANVLVLDHSFGAITSDNGNIELTNIPSGEWRFRAWHPQTGLIRVVFIDGERNEWEDGYFTIDIKPGSNDMGTISFDNGDKTNDWPAKRAR